MTYLSEDPTYLAGALVVLAGAFFVALYATQQGKYLISGGVALGLALVVVAIEWLWVTDNERIEQVVYDLRSAVLKSDADRALTHMSPHVQYLNSDMALSEDVTRAMIRNSVSQARFDFIRISNLQISVAEQARRGKAEFRVFTRGTVGLLPTMAEPATAVSTWSLGFQETEPHVWKVNRISPVSLPSGAFTFLGGMMPGNGSRISLNKDGIGILPAQTQPAKGSQRFGMRNPRALKSHTSSTTN